MPIKNTINKAKTIQKVLYDSVNNLKIKSNRKDPLLAYGIEIAREHHASMILLANKKMYASMYALMRPILETIYRTLYIHKICTDEEIEKIYIDEYKFPEFWKIAKKLDEHDNKNKEENEKTMGFQNVKKETYSIFSDLTHTGSQQLLRRGKKGKISPNYRDEDTLYFIDRANKNLCMLSIYLFMILKDEEKKKLFVNLLKD